MNIFALHPSPRKSARWHVDAHVVKMLLETCQLLYTVHWVKYYVEIRTATSPQKLAQIHKGLPNPPSMQTAPFKKGSDSIRGYKPCHVNHPSAKWCRLTIGNYRWLAQLGLELAREFRHRFHHEHSCEKHIIWLSENPPHFQRNIGRTEFVMAMADEYMISRNPFVSYRHYYKTAKADKGIIKYTNRHPPHWLSEPVH